MDELARGLLGLNSMHDTLICHVLARTSTAAKSLSWHHSQHSPYSLSTSTQEETQAQNGCRFHRFLFLFAKELVRREIVSTVSDVLKHLNYAFG